MIGSSTGGEFMRLDLVGSSAMIMWMDLGTFLVEFLYAPCLVSETTLALLVELLGRYLRYISQQSSSTMFVGGMNHSRKQTSLKIRVGGYEQAHGFFLSVVWKS